MNLLGTDIFARAEWSSNWNKNYWTNCYLGICTIFQSRRKSLSLAVTSWYTQQKFQMMISSKLLFPLSFSPNQTFTWCSQMFILYFHFYSLVSWNSATLKPIPKHSKTHFEEVFLSHLQVESIWSLVSYKPDFIISETWAGGALNAVVTSGGILLSAAVGWWRVSAYGALLHRCLLSTLTHVASFRSLLPLSHYASTWVKHVSSLHYRVTALHLHGPAGGHLCCGDWHIRIASYQPRRLMTGLFLPPAPVRVKWQECVPVNSLYPG